MEIFQADNTFTLCPESINDPAFIEMPEPFSVLAALPVKENEPVAAVTVVLVLPNIPKFDNSTNNIITQFFLLTD